MLPGPQPATCNLSPFLTSVRLLVFLLSLFLLPCLRAQDVDSLLETYLAGYWKANPARAATPSGVHAYDAQLEDFSPLAMDLEIQRNRAALKAFERLSPAGLAAGQRVDREMVMDRIRLALLDLQQLQRWKRDPGSYVCLLRESVAALVGREFAPAERRYTALAARLKGFPKLLQQARMNLDRPPRLATREAIGQIAEAADWIEKQVPQAAAEQGASKKLRKRVAQEAARAAASLRQFGAWLQSDLLPRSVDAPLFPSPPGSQGGSLYRDYFRYYLGAALTAEELQAAAERDVLETRERMRQVAGQINSSQSVPQALGEIAAARLPQDKLAAAFREGFSDARRFVEERGLVSLPDRDRLRILTVPSYWLAGPARLEAPGPFEPDLPWLYYVPAPELLGVEQAEFLLRDSNPIAISLLAVRDGYPGKYVQSEAMSRSSNLARKVFASRAFTEGWALYCEQMVFEEGFRPDPRARLLQLHHALVAQLEAVIDVRLHSGGLSPADAVSLLVNDGFLDQAAAEEQVERALLFPGEAAAPYAGKLEILRLREELRKRQGPAFVLKEFHDRLLSLGAPPLRLARDLLLNEQ